MEAIAANDFVSIILEELRAHGVQQAHKGGHLRLTALEPWPGDLVCAKARYGDRLQTAGVLIGPEFGTVGAGHMVEAAQEAKAAGCDILLACAFSFDALAPDAPAVPVLRVRMNHELHLSGELTGTGNVFVLFGEPDAELLEDDIGFRVRLRGMDVFDPGAGDVRSDEADDVACWFVDTEYRGDCFRVRQAYFPGMKHPYDALARSLRSEINPDAVESLSGLVSRPFPRPATGRVAVKAINGFGDEAIKVLPL